MSRINTNIPSLVGRIHLSRSQGDLQTALDRLSTGLRINSGKDDPAGLIASEQLGSEIASVRKAISNTQQADHIIATADSALGQVSRLLNDIRGLVTEAANTGALSDDQVAANQLQVDSSLEAIDRIVAITSFQGKKLLDGSLGFLTSGVSTAAFGSLDVQQATLPSSGNLSLTLTVSTPAAKASITGSNANLAQAFVVEVAGSKGVEVFTFGTGTTPTQVVAAINLVSDAIGVQASLGAGGEYVFDSQDYGSQAFVEVKQITASGTFAGAGTRAYGGDVIGSVNGATYASRGLGISLNTATLDLKAQLTTAFGTTIGSTTFSLTGGGAKFQLGPDVVSSQQVRIAIDSSNTSRLGTSVNGALRRLYELRSGQAADLDSDPTIAFQIVDGVINKVTALRGSLGAIQRTTLETNIASLNDTLTNLTEAQSSILDTDFAEETARLTRAQILVQSGSSVLQISNQNPQNVLALLPRG